MTIVKWTVSPFGSPPARQEYSHETANFYMHSRGRGRDPKDSNWQRYFDSEAEALEFIRLRNENKAEKKRVDHIKRHAVELLEALELVTDCLQKCLTGGEVSAILAGSALVKSAEIIAKAKGEA